MAPGKMGGIQVQFKDGKDNFSSLDQPLSGIDAPTIRSAHNKNAKPERGTLL